MAHRWKNNLTRDDVTPYDAYLNRRQLMGGLAGLGFVSMAGTKAQASELEPNTWEEITTYNNFYEFGTGKGMECTTCSGIHRWQTHCHQEAEQIWKRIFQL